MAKKLPGDITLTFRLELQERRVFAPQPPRERGDADPEQVGGQNAVRHDLTALRPVQQQRTQLLGERRPRPKAEQRIVGDMVDDPLQILRRADDLARQVVGVEGQEILRLAVDDRGNGGARAVTRLA